MLAIQEDINPGSSTPLLSATIGDSTVNEIVESTLNSSHIVPHNDFYNKNILVSEEHGVCIRINIDESGFDFKSFQLQLRVCIDTIYSEGVYFSHLERESLECVLYGTQEAVRSKINPIYGWIRICSQIKKMTDTQFRMFDKIYGWKIQISKDIMEVIYIPNPLDYIKRQLWENYMNNGMFTLQGDLFHAYFWWYGVKYYGDSSFLKDVNMRWRDTLDDVLKNSKWVIAIWKKITDTRDDKKLDFEQFEKEKEEKIKWGQVVNNTVNNFPPLKIKKRPLLINGKVAPGWEMECIFPKALKGQCILEIIFWELGNNGIAISGQILPCAEIKQISLLDLLDTTHSEYTHIDTTDPNKIRIVAKEDVYISIDKQGKLWFSRFKKYIGHIWPKTGSITLPMDGTTFELRWDIQEWYFIKGFDIIYLGQLSGHIYAQNNVSIQGGWIIWWTVIAEKGNITIDKSVRVQDRTRLEAINGKVIINWDLSSATIIASEIIVSWVATNCTFVAGNVAINENNGSRVLAETFTITKDRSGKSEYVILVYAGIHGLMNILEQKIKDTEWKWLLEISRVKNMWKWLEWDQLIIGDTIHPDARLQLFVIPYIIQENLFELLSPDVHPTVLWARKKNWLLNLASLDMKGDGIMCSKSNLPLNRMSLIALLEEKLQNRFISRDERNPLYARWARIDASVGQLKWHIFDYSNTWSSFILINKEKDNGSIMKDSTIDVTIMNHLIISFFVTRVEIKEVKGVNYVFISGMYLSQWTEQDISRIVTIYDTKQKKI